MEKKLKEKIEKKLSRETEKGESEFERKGRIFVSIGIGIVITIMFLTICYWTIMREPIRVLLFDYFIIGLTACLISAISAVITTNHNPDIKEIFQKLFISISSIILLVINIAVMFPMIGLLVAIILLAIAYVLIERTM